MTIFGVHVNDSSHAWAWADTEIYKGDLPVGDCCKLAVNSLANLVGVAAGPIEFLRQVHREIMASASIDHFAAFFPHRLMARNAKSGQCATVGRSNRFGRMVAYSFAADESFTARLTSTATCPHEDITYSPESADDLVSIARAQLVTMRKTLPLANGRILTVAEVGQCAITARPYYDFESGRRLQSPPVPRAQLMTT